MDAVDVIWSIILGLAASPLLLIIMVVIVVPIVLLLLGGVLNLIKEILCAVGIFPPDDE